MGLTRFSACLILLFTSTISVLANAYADDDQSGNNNLDLNKAERGLMYPGTHHCGPGSSRKDDKAILANVDKCCKTHDSCPISILKGKKKYGLKNNGSYTVSSCECDTTFRSCLKRVGGFHAGVVGTIFNKTAGKTCIKTTFVKKCVNYSQGKCLTFKTEAKYSFVTSRINIQG